MAKSLLKLEMNKPKLYAFLNALADILVKPIPIFIWMLYENSYQFGTGENVIQNVIIGIMNVIGAFLASIMAYGMILLVIQIIKLFVCTYKPLVIHIRIFDIVIKLYSHSIRNGKDMELKNYLNQHEMIVKDRKEKRGQKVSDAKTRKRQRDMEDLEYARKNFAESKDRADRYIRSAEANFDHARNGVFFTEQSRADGKRDLSNATYEEEMAARELERIRSKERALGIKSND